MIELKGKEEKDGVMFAWIKKLQTIPPILDQKGPWAGLRDLELAFSPLEKLTHRRGKCLFPVTQQEKSERKELLSC